MVLGFTFINWNAVIQATSGPFWYLIPSWPSSCSSGVRFGRRRQGAAGRFVVGDCGGDDRGFGVAGVRFVALAR